MKPSLRYCVALDSCESIFNLYFSWKKERWLLEEVSYSVYKAVYTTEIQHESGRIGWIPEASSEEPVIRLT